MTLLVIDTQKLITNNRLYQFDIFVKNVKALISKAREKGIEVVYVRHDDGQGQALTKGTDGFEIYDDFRPEAGEIVFDKKVNSPFKETGLLEYLKKKEEQELIVVGLQTDYCIDATVKCGFEHGFRMIVPEHTNTTFDNELLSAENTYQYYNEFVWKNRYAECVSMEDAFTMMGYKEGVI